MTYLTIPIAANTVEQAKSLIAAASAAGAEMLELRTDYLEDLTTGAVEMLIAEVKARNLPMIVTCRDKKQGGQGEWPLYQRMDILTAAIKAGAEYVDCEYETILIAEVEKELTAVLADSRCRLILSHHNFEGPFENIQKLYDMIVTEYPSAIPKLVYTARHINDCFAGFDLLHTKEGDAIVFAMGEAGLISRIIAKKLGSLITFVSLDECSATAPGQLTIDRFKKQFRYDSITAKTQLFGVIADPVAHSISPAVHNACFADAGMDRLYLPLRVQGDTTGFDAFMKNIVARLWLDFHGFSITIPHKMNAIEYVEKAGGFIEPVAVQIGAINTITIGINDRVNGYNTDCAGAMDAITAAMGINKKQLADVPVAVVGSGGAARAIVAGLADVGAAVTIYNRTLEKAHKLAHEFRVHAASLSALATMEAKILINGTSIGMHPDVDETPVPKEYLRKDMIVFDTVYNPLETQLLKEAKEIGATTISGAEMFINQAAEQFKLFTHSQPNIAVLRKTAVDCLGG
jgi:3-dehydroquinate dehydratase/shikimate dehydrogenase